MIRPRIAIVMTSFAGLLALNVLLSTFVFWTPCTPWAGGKPRKVEGSVEKVEVEESSGSQNLDQAAIEAAKKWTFDPVAGSYSLTLRFEAGWEEKPAGPP